MTVFLFFADIRDEEIPHIKAFSKAISAFAVAYYVIFIFFSILLIAGVTASKRYLLVPWLVVAFLSIVFIIVMNSFASFDRC